RPSVKLRGIGMVLPGIFIWQVCLSRLTITPDVDTARWTHRRIRTMTFPPRMACALLVAGLGLGPVLAQKPAVRPADTKTPAQPTDAKSATDKLPMCGPPPGKILPNLCVLKYRINTNSPECQAFFDQGLGFFYSYVWMEAARSFETATRHDPDCAMAWWGLSRA